MKNGRQGCLIARQQRELEELHELVVQLRDEIARLKNQNSSNSSKPPSSDIINPQPRTKHKKRKRGGQAGHQRCQRQLFPPEQVDETIIHELPDDEIQRRKLIPLDEYESALQQVKIHVLWAWIFTSQQGKAQKGRLKRPIEILKQRLKIASTAYDPAAGIGRLRRCVGR